MRHGKDLFKAEGAVNAAEPGNTGTNLMIMKFINVKIDNKENA